MVALPQIQLTGLAHLDNPWGVTLLHIVFQLSFSVLLFTAFLRSIPGELEESARIDGASEWQIFSRVVIPQIKGTIITVATGARFFGPEAPPPPAPCGSAATPAVNAPLPSASH